MILLIQYTLIFASVLTLVALGGCFSEHSGVINLGLEGVMVMGALGGALMLKNMAGKPFVLEANYRDPAFSGCSPSPALISRRTRRLSARR